MTNITSPVKTVTTDGVLLRRYVVERDLGPNGWLALQSFHNLDTARAAAATYAGLRVYDSETETFL
jgi:hypothetical protein